MSDPRPRRLRKVSITTVIALVLTTAVSTVVIAQHSFPVDVPDDNTFHNDIAWLADNDVTRGCNPPDNDAFCPEDPVTREQMSAFMHRFAGTFGVVGDQVTDDSDPVTVDTTDFVELLAVQVRTEADANVALDAHASIEIDTAAEGLFDVAIARDTCDGDVVGAGTWRITQDEGALPNTTLSITGFDQIADVDEQRETTTYLLCAAKGDDTSLDGTVFQRGLTATSVPSE